MKNAGMSAILVLALVSLAYGGRSLTVNGDPCDLIVLELGQSCTVEISSPNNSCYIDFIGFYQAPVLGTFEHLETDPNAGDANDVSQVVTVPNFYGYRVIACGNPPYPRPGIHFVFEYVAQEVGETDVNIYAGTAPPNAPPMDSVHISVVPLSPTAMGTAFTYEGQLVDANAAADGLYDFEFSLYDNPDPCYAAQQGNTVSVNEVDVIGGYFTVELDFGSDVFNGDARWLEIAVRSHDPCDVNAFTRLLPRQELTPTPYALQTRGMFVDNAGNVGIGTTTPSGKLEVYGRTSLRGNLYQYGEYTYQNGVWEYVYSESGNLDPNGDVTISVPGRLYVTTDNIVFTYKAWISVDPESSYPHDYRGAGHIRGHAWKERGYGVSGYFTEKSYYKGRAVSITPSTYSGDKTQFAIDTTAPSRAYKFTVRATSGAH
ncbi:MAG: hypothetical protein ACYTEL_14520 [Planctomycetota bacterium]|jgi:hypothetical protein